MTEKSSKEWYPEIVYQEGSKVPFIEVPFEHDMPDKIYMFEFKQTGEYEPGPDGKEIPICDMKAHIYFDYEVAKQVLDAELLDKLRTAFGLQPLDEAMERGKKITEKISNNAVLKP